MHSFYFNFIFCLFLCSFMLFPLPFSGSQIDGKPSHIPKCANKKKTSDKKIQNNIKSPVKEFIPPAKRKKEIAEQLIEKNQIPLRQIIEVGGKEVAIKKNEGFIPIPQRRKTVYDKPKNTLKPIETKNEEKYIESKIENKKDKLAVTEIINSIRDKLTECWIIPEGIAYKEGFNIKINLLLSNKGEIIMADIADSNSYRNNMLFRSIADSAMRAVYKCSPLTGLPSEHHNIWREVTLDFILPPLT